MFKQNFTVVASKVILTLTLTLLLNIAYAVATPLKPISVMLDWYINPDHTPLLIAQSKGYFKQAGLKVTLMAPSDTSDALKLVAANQVTYGVSYPNTVKQAQARDLPIVRIGNLIDQPLLSMVVLKNGPIKTLKNLKGKTIAVNNLGSHHQILDAMLHDANLTRHNITLIDVHYNVIQSLLSHRVDALMNVMRNVEVVELENMGYPVRVFLPEDYGLKPDAGLIFITHKNNGVDNKAFMHAVNQGKAYWVKHPNESWRLVIKDYPTLDTPMTKKVWDATLKMI